MVPIRGQLLQQGAVTPFTPGGHNRAGRTSGGWRFYTPNRNAVGRMQVSYIRTKKDIASSRDAVNRQFILFLVAQLLWVQI